MALRKTVVAVIPSAFDTGVKVASIVKANSISSAGMLNARRLGPDMRIFELGCGGNGCLGAGRFFGSTPDVASAVSGNFSFPVVSGSSSSAPALSETFFAETLWWEFNDQCSCADFCVC